MPLISQLIIIILSVSPFQPGNNSRVFNFINEGHIDSLALFLEEHDVNGRYGIDSISLLSYSIIINQPDVISFLLENGADPCLEYLGSSPLIMAAMKDHIKTVRLLIRFGADINDTDSKGNTALIHAASRGNLPIAKILIRAGANINYRNPRHDNAYDAAVKSNYQEVASYLRTQYEKNLPEMKDGPFINWNASTLKAFYMVHDSTRQIAKKHKRRFKTTGDTYHMKGFAGDTITYHIRKGVDVPDYDFRNIARIMAIGDIHGGYDSLVLFLRNNGVIDQNHNWSWGDGHVVFMGDIFDRGSKVTEALWLIYHLEHEAREKGGNVHLILGNHEIMNFQKDLGYIADKYHYLNDKLNTSYSWLFNKKSILGAWLRSRNAIIRINDNLFVHAGISPELAFSKLSIEDVNNIVRFLNLHPERHPYSQEIEKLMFGYLGPFWYRGYLEESDYYRRPSYNELMRILELYEVNRIFIGHTSVKNITPLYNDHIYPLDVPFYTYGYSMEGLLIENDLIFLLKTSGKKVLME